VQHLVELLPTADVDACGRIHQHQKTRPALERTKEEQLLLIATTERPERHVCAPQRPHIVARQQRVSRFPLVSETWQNNVGIAQDTVREEIFAHRQIGKSGGGPDRR
jgi:hypothetical protein